ncbi:MAG: alpha-glucosidase C-terminal domain-containing protein, partial [Thermoplasmata archaeon]
SVELDLKPFRDASPIEMFGRTPFPKITDAPYGLTLGPYDFYWFLLASPVAEAPPEATSAPEPLLLEATADWGSLGSTETRELLESFLPAYLPTQRWFRGKGMPIESVRWMATLPLSGVGDGAAARLALIEVLFSDGEPQRYLMPVAFETVRPPASLAEGAPSPALASFRPGAGAPEGILRDVAQEPEFVRRVIGRISGNRRRREGEDELVARRTGAFRTEEEASAAELPVVPLGGEQSNSSSRIGDRYAFKLFRLVEPGPNPETELGEFFLRHGSAPVAPLTGYLELRTSAGEVFTLASLHDYVPNEGDAWGLTRDHLRGYFDRARAHFAGGPPPSEE